MFGLLGISLGGDVINLRLRIVQRFFERAYRQEANLDNRKEKDRRNLKLSRKKLEIGFIDESGRKKEKASTC
jgi:hypothetical protein